MLVEPGLQLGITGDGSRLDERLELPRVGPLIPVGLVRHERAHERAVRPCGRRFTSTRKQRRAISSSATRPLRCRVPVTVADEHHVDVARIVQLVPAELPHPDDDERLGRIDKRRRASQDVATEGCDGGDRDLELVATQEIRAAMRRYSRDFQRLSASGLDPSTAGLGSRSARISSAPESTSRSIVSDRLAPHTAMTASRRLGSASMRSAKEG